MISKDLKEQIVKLVAVGLKSHAEIKGKETSLEEQSQRAQEMINALLKNSKGLCECGAQLHECYTCNVADYQASNPDCQRCCSNSIRKK
jgi:hypothetical protein